MFLLPVCSFILAFACVLDFAFTSAIMFKLTRACIGKFIFTAFIAIHLTLRYIYVLLCVNMCFTFSIFCSYFYFCQLVTYVYV